MALIVTFSHSQVSFTPLVREVITYKLFPDCNRVDLYKYFFSQRIIGTWNTLPAKLNNFSSLARFTRFLRSANLSHFHRSGTNRSRFLVVFNVLRYFVHQRLLVQFGLGVLLSCMFVCLCILHTVLHICTESFLNESQIA